MMLTTGVEYRAVYEAAKETYRFSASIDYEAAPEGTVLLTTTVTAPLRMVVSRQQVDAQERAAAQRALRARPTVVPSAEDLARAYTIRLRKATALRNLLLNATVGLSIVTEAPAQGQITVDEAVEKHLKGEAQAAGRKMLLPDAPVQPPPPPAAKSFRMRRVLRGVAGIPNVL